MVLPFVMHRSSTQHSVPPSSIVELAEENELSIILDCCFVYVSPVSYVLAYYSHWWPVEFLNCTKSLTTVARDELSVESDRNIHFA